MGLTVFPLCCELSEVPLAVEGTTIQKTKKAKRAWDRRGQVLLSARPFGTSVWSSPCFNDYCDEHSDDPWLVMCIQDLILLFVDAWRNDENAWWISHKRRMKRFWFIAGLSKLVQICIALIVHYVCSTSTISGSECVCIWLIPLAYCSLSMCVSYLYAIRQDMSV